MEETAFMIRLAIFTLAISPLLYEYFTTDTASNRGNLILLAVGLAFTGYEISMGLREASVGLIAGWLITFVGALVMMASKVIPGGLGKMIIALTPWFNFPQLMFVIAIGMLTTALIAKLRGGRAKFVGPVYLASCAVWMFQLMPD
jgi:hypothetical protein